ncbi:MAG: DNA polymerase III subunit beta [Cyanobacteria bacterium SID2]|nr:DNA polymerase III subunit beta [Cyanobacteria bacterium SID2]MBP0003538.1 DNA polymerase III subunit beta [Cyanobacteria bacterium SBC]
MKLVCTQGDLNTHLSLAAHAVPSRPTHPVLANVRLTADGENQYLQLTAFDLSLGIRVTLPAQVESGGEITLPAKLLNDIVSRLPEGEITLEHDADQTLTTLKCASGQYQIQGMSAEEFPELPVVESGKVVHLSTEALVEGLRGTLFATSSDETKQVLTGVHLAVRADGLEFAATDGHRLAVVEVVNLEGEDAPKSEIKEGEVFEVTVPAQAFRELERTMGKRSGTELVALHFDEGQAIFEVDDRRLTSRTLEGSYPAYRQLIPRQFENQVNVDRRQLLGALERIAVIADKKNNIVKFSLDNQGQQLTLSVDAADVGSANEILPVQISGDSMDIAFNVKYVMQSLQNLQSTEIQMQLNTPVSPVILTPLGGTKMTHLVMPVQIRD